MSGIHGCSLGSRRATCSETVERGSASCTVASLLGGAPYEEGAAFGGDGALARVASAKFVQIHSLTSPFDALTSESEVDDDIVILGHFLRYSSHLSQIKYTSYLL